MKKIITTVVIVLLAVGLGYWLFKLSPTPAPPQGYNALLETPQLKPTSTPAAFDPAVDHYLGRKDAKNVFIEYGDMQCPACASYNDILKQVPSQFSDTVFVFRYFPLLQLHQNSVESALANEAAGLQGKYWEMHDLLFQKQADWESLSEPLDTFAQYAQQAGVADIAKFKADVTAKKNLALIQQQYAESLNLKLPGTPSLYYNGHALEAQDMEGLKKQAAQWEK